MEAAEIHFGVVRPYVYPAKSCEGRNQKSETSYPMMREKKFQKIRNVIWIQSQTWKIQNENVEKMKNVRRQQSFRLLGLRRMLAGYHGDEKKTYLAVSATQVVH